VTPRTILTATVAALAYVAMWVGYLQGWVWLTAIDDGMLGYFHDIGVAHPGWVTAWNWFCMVFDPMTLRILALIPIVWLLRRGQPRVALFLLLSVELSAVVTEIAKALANRPRPPTALVYAPSTSFPSGHALGIMVCVLALLTVALPVVASRWHTPLMLLGAAIVLAIGIGRVVLNVHHPSDVIAGWALGCLYYLVCLPVLTARAERPAVPGRAN
jgi:undecaprenyl-diphosphatase